MRGTLVKGNVGPMLTKAPRLTASGASSFFSLLFARCIYMGFQRSRCKTSEKKGGSQSGRVVAWGVGRKGVATGSELVMQAFTSWFDQGSREEEKIAQPPPRTRARDATEPPPHRSLSSKVKASHEEGEDGAVVPREQFQLNHARYRSSAPSRRLQSDFCRCSDRSPRNKIKFC